jgi:hypothetical protein
VSPESQSPHLLLLFFFPESPQQVDNNNQHNKKATGIGINAKEMPTKSKQNSLNSNASVIKTSFDDDDDSSFQDILAIFLF